jgi:ligand-binding SRPBCC domain-containing protein
MGRFKLVRIIDAPLEKVWAAADFTKSAGPFSMEAAQKGDPALNGVGFVRVVTSGKRKVTERLEAIDSLHSYTYTLVEGVPVKKGYVGKVEFTPKGGATQITWTGQFAPKAPGSGWLIALMTKRTVRKILDAIDTASCQANWPLPKPVLYC